MYARSHLHCAEMQRLLRVADLHQSVSDLLRVGVRVLSQPRPMAKPGTWTLPLIVYAVRPSFMRRMSHRFAAFRYLSTTTLHTGWHYSQSSNDLCPGLVVALRLRCNSPAPPYSQSSQRSCQGQSLRKPVYFERPAYICSFWSRPPLRGTSYCCCFEVSADPAAHGSRVAGLNDPMSSLPAQS